MIVVSAAIKLERLLLAYVKDRCAFDQTVWDFQNTKFKLADIKAQSVALRTMVDYYLAAHMSRRLTVEDAAIAKLFAAETLWKCIDDMVQLHGGYVAYSRPRRSPARWAPPASTRGACPTTRPAPAPYPRRSTVFMSRSHAALRKNPWLPPLWFDAKPL